MLRLQAFIIHSACLIHVNIHFIICVWPFKYFLVNVHEHQTALAAVRHCWPYRSVNCLDAALKLVRTHTIARAHTPHFSISKLSTFSILFSSFLWFNLNFVTVNKVLQLLYVIFFLSQPEKKDPQTHINTFNNFIVCALR